MIKIFIIYTTFLSIAFNIALGAVQIQSGDSTNKKFIDFDNVEEHSADVLTKIIEQLSHTKYNTREENSLKNFLVGYLNFKIKNYGDAIKFLNPGSKKFILEDYRLFYLCKSQSEFGLQELQRGNAANSIKMLESALNNCFNIYKYYPKSVISKDLSKTIAKIEENLGLNLLKLNDQENSLSSLSKALLRYDGNATDQARILTYIAGIHFKKGELPEAQNSLLSMISLGFSYSDIKTYIRDYAVELEIILPNIIDKMEPKKEKISEDVYFPKELELLEKEYFSRLNAKQYSKLPKILKKALTNYCEQSSTLKMISSFNDAYIIVAKKSYEEGGKFRFLKDFVEVFGLYPPDQIYPLADKLIINHFHDLAETLLLKNIERCSLSPKPDKTKYYLARLYEDKKDFSAAINYYKMLIDGHPQSQFFEKSIFKIAWINYLNGNFNEAISNFGRYISQDKYEDFMTPSYFWLAMSYKEAGDEQKYLNTLDKLSGKHSFTYYGCLARIILKKSFSPLIKKFNNPNLINLYFSGIFQNENIQKAQTFLYISLPSLAQRELDSVDFYKKPALFNIYFAILNKQANNLFKSIYIANYVLSNTPEIANKNLFNLLYPKNYDSLITDFSYANNVDPYLIYSLIRQESVFDSSAVSPANAIGLMQLLEKTATTLYGKKLTKNDLFDPKTNIMLGINYIRNLIHDFNGDTTKALAAYNAGPENARYWSKVRAYKNKLEFIESIPFAETRNYVKLIIKNFIIYKYIHEGIEYKSLDEIEILK